MRRTCQSYSGFVCYIYHSSSQLQPEANVSLDGGGYGLFGAVYDPSQLMKTNDNGFISVVIQYRLGAFGFLSSEDVKGNGQLNAGLLDQRFALQWVQENIEKFGGDPRKVTLAGESAGAGSVMLQAMAYGGMQDVTPFDNVRYHLVSSTTSNHLTRFKAYSRQCVFGKAVPL